MIHRFSLCIMLAGMLLWLPAAVVAQETGPGVTIRVVQRGETLLRIAQEYDMSVDELARMNGILDVNNIQVGQRLLVPSNEAVAAPHVQIHLVQAGESLRTIAALYNVDPYQLAEANGVTASNPLYVGQELSVTVPPEVVEPAVEPETAPPAVAAEPQTVAASDELQPSGITLHTVASGETLFRIAERYGLTTAEVAAANGITDPTLIFAGQQLIIPGADPQMLALDLPDVVESISVDPLALTEGRTGSFRLRTTETLQVSSRFLERDIPVLTMDDGSYMMLVGVPIFTQAGVYPLEITLIDGTGAPVVLTINIQVLGGTYRSERVNLIGDRAELVNINVENAERQILSDVMSKFTTIAYLNGPMSLPAAASMTSPFGSRRAYNGGDFDRFHSGADFAGAAGSPVLAPAAGMVVLADTLNICGMTTVIDHGLGIYTAYCHQSEQYVHPGDVVSTGQVIGLVGATGRTTGAHLHWELWVNGVPVDPMQWVRQSFF